MQSCMVIVLVLSLLQPSLVLDLFHLPRHNHPCFFCFGRFRVMSGPLISTFDSLLRGWCFDRSALLSTKYLFLHYFRIFRRREGIMVLLCVLLLRLCSFALCGCQKLLCCRAHAWGLLLSGALFCGSLGCHGFALLQTKMLADVLCFWWCLS